MATKSVGAAGIPAAADVPSSMSRQRFLGVAGAGVGALLLPGTASATGSRWFARSIQTLAPRDSVVVRWNIAALQAVRNSKLGPPMVARALAIVHTCIYDAWAAYDRTAAGTMPGGSLRRPARERTVANLSKAISYAAYRAGADLFRAERLGGFDPLMASLGYDPSDVSTDTTTPQGIGNVAAKAVLDFRHRDGANQLGDVAGGVPGVPYSDYTGFKALNRPLNMTAAFDPSTVVDVAKWQPMQYVDGSGNFVTQGFVGAQWQNVIPFALRSGNQLRSSSGVLKTGSPDFLAQHQALVELSGNLTDREKMIAEYWADGPRSELPPGHWDLFAQYVARRDHHGDGRRGIERDVKLFFALTNAIFDAGICAWDHKVAFVGCRPTTSIRVLFYGKPIAAWAGPGKGARTISGETWVPFQPTTFPTPPFPGYTSGHSTFSAAGAEILRSFTRKNSFGNSVTLPAGSSRVEPAVTPAADVTLRWRTFSAAVAQAGISRRYGGIHVEEDDLAGRATGRACGREAWAKAVQLWGSGAL